MSETNYIYIIPGFAGIIQQKNPAATEWEMTNDGDYSPTSDPFRHYYDEFKRTISESSGKWSIVFRRYKKINAVVFIIKKLNEHDNPATWNDSDMIFSKYRRECGVKAITFNKNYALKIIDNNMVLPYPKAIHDALYLERNEKNELHRADILHYELKTNFDAKLARTIEDDIITILSVSSIAFYYISPFLNEDSMNYQNIIKAFWGYKSHLLRCQAAQVFPLFFKDKIRIIDNLLDYKSMDIIDKQNKLIADLGMIMDNINKAILEQKKSVSNQESILGNINTMINRLDATVTSLAEFLGGIHSAENGILSLTFLVVFEVLLRLTKIELGFTPEFLGFIVIFLFIYLLIWFFILRRRNH